MTEVKFIGKIDKTNDKQFGRKTLKKSFEERMNLPYYKFTLYQK